MDVTFAGSVWPRAVERTLAGTLGKLSTFLHLDLRQVTFIDLQSAMMLVALGARVAAKGRDLSVSLPITQAPSEFLAAWEFPEALSEVTGKRLNDLLSYESRKQYATTSDPRSNRYMDARPDEAGILLRLYSARFFAIQTFTRQLRLFSPSLAVDVTKQWREAMVARILEKMLPTGPELFRTRIVFEAMMNAIRHPNAATIQTSSLVRSVPSQERFCVTFWDDGRQICSTLRSALRARLSIRGEAFGAINCEYFVYSRSRRTYFSASDMPQLGWSDSELLLASTFPGITCDPQGRTQGTEEPTPPGMGLYYLINAAVTIFGGRVTIRSGRSIITIERSKRQTPGIEESFKVNMRSTHMGAWTHGNLLWIELPTALEAESDEDLKETVVGQHT